ncbi:hypothetical protein DCE93_02640 [Agromyces badenianii]|uniref:Uncharacterized protein n=1 Tax=Agromyces badenianii TaxID=2080742 RepID=A0A2S0WTS2_9MICO|nr:hypothetical protein [Agromyces badenianii]AWB94690.1 hypothetical protein DCE93_02640 [Agromyces badenianii]
MPAAIALCVILAALAVFQLALALGAPIGHFAWGGQHRVLPPRLRIGSAVSIVIYAIIAALALDRVGIIDVVSDTVSTVGMWIVFGYFVLGIPMNAISRSRAERFTMTPVVIVLALLSLLIALG